MSQASYATKIYTAGDAIGFTSEPTTKLGPNRFQITEPTRRLLDLAQVHSTSAGSIVSVDSLNGIIVIDTDPASITFSGSFLPLGFVGGSKSYSYELSSTVLDNTDFETAQANGGWRTRELGLLDVNCSIDRWDDLGQKFVNHKQNREIVFLEITPGGTGESIRGWFVVETDGKSGDIDNQEEESISFNLATNLTGSRFSYS